MNRFTTKIEDRATGASQLFDKDASSAQPIRPRIVYPFLAGVFALTLSACSDTGVTIANPDQTPEDQTELQSLDQTSSSRSDIVTTAVGAGSFNTLAAALTVTGLDTVLSDTTREFTVFAPNDDAFAKLGNDTITALLADTEKLKNILLYHVIADASVDGATATSLAGNKVNVANGDQIAISVDDGKLFINTSEVIAADVMASNGIIHVIDTVLLPPEETTEPPASPQNIIETAQAAGQFNTLLAALEATGLSDVLTDANTEFTVFAPTDDAFAALGQDTINALLADPDTLSDILLYHVLSGQRVDSSTAISLAGQTVETANSDSIALSIQGGSLFINDSEVIAADVQASNGIIHVIDAVLLPPAEPEVEAPATPTESPAGTILEVASQAGFSILVAAAEAAHLDGALNHPGDFYTVFAPTDEAFAALGQDTIDSLLADPDTLRNILLYHVLPGNVIDAAGVAQILGFSIQTGNGDNIVIEERNGALFINDSKIILTDVEAVNGIIHVIDAVLIPPAH